MSAGFYVYPHQNPAWDATGTGSAYKIPTIFRQRFAEQRAVMGVL